MKHLTLLPLLLLAGGIYPSVDNSKPDVDELKAVRFLNVSFEEPSSDLKSVVAPLQGVISDEEDALKAASFFLEFAGVLARDKDVIPSTGVLREGFILAEKLMLQRTKMVGKYPGFGEIKDKVLEEAIGLENVPLDSEKRAKAVAVFKAMAWAVGGNNGG